MKRFIAAAFGAAFSFLASAQTPAPAVAPAGGYSNCAAENAVCLVLGPSQVIYGAPGGFTAARAQPPGTFLCDNDTFGDPLPGTVKACWVKPDRQLTTTIVQRWLLLDDAGKRVANNATDLTSCAAAALTASLAPGSYSCAQYASVEIAWTGPEAAPPPIIIPVPGVPHMHGGLDIDPRVILPRAVGSDQVKVQATAEVAPAADIGQFRTACGVAAMDFVDPIVYPGENGKAHLHTFFGNTGINANSTPESIANTGNSTCRGGIANRSAYWVPTMIDMDSGLPVPSGELGPYYKAGYELPSESLQPLPAGLRMVAGNPQGNSPETSSASRFKCIGGPNDENDKYGPSIPDCDAGASVVQEIFFPQCWDGKNLDSPDHKSHMAYPVTLYDPFRFECPATHPVGLPAIAFNLSYVVPVAHAALRWRLSSDNYDASLPGGYSGHADWFNGWRKDISDAWAKGCINAKVDCHSHLLGDGRMIY